MTEENNLEASEKTKLTNTWECWRVSQEKEVPWNQTIKQNHIRRIYNWAFAFVRYWGPFYKWMREELQ